MSQVRCVGRFGGGNEAYFKPGPRYPGHGYEEEVCITCSGSVRVRVMGGGQWRVLLDQVYLGGVDTRMVRIT